MDSVLSCTAAGVRFEFKREPYGFTVRFHRHFGKEWDALLNASENEPEKGPEIRKSRELVERATAVLEQLRQNPYITRGELAEKLGISKRQARSSVELLKSRELIRHEGPAKGGYWIVNE
jgi:predicted HTH transcriptional regulator